MKQGQLRDTDKDAAEGCGKGRESYGLFGD